MKNNREQQIYVALLRGINVGGHHKIPMEELRTTFEAMGHTQVKTLLNSGNVIFEGKSAQVETLEEKIASQLEKSFGFSIPVLVRKADDIKEITACDPFKDIQIHKDIRLYVTFFKESPKENLKLPWVSADGSFQIIKVKGRAVCSVLDVSKSKTPYAMNVLEKSYNKDITTRNWNTVVKIELSFHEL
ncbi:MAG: DUF1697 domain-containing protein [Anditalea sp.]